MDDLISCVCVSAQCSRAYFTISQIVYQVGRYFEIFTIDIDVEAFLRCFLQFFFLHFRAQRHIFCEYVLRRYCSFMFRCQFSIQGKTRCAKSVAVTLRKDILKPVLYLLSIPFAVISPEKLELLINSNSLLQPTNQPTFIRGVNYDFWRSLSRLYKKYES